MPVVNGRDAIRVGILGDSDIARRRFLPALQKSTQACLSALASRTPDRAPSRAMDRDVKQVTYQELIHDPSIELVYISLPNHLHEEWSVKALKQGKHVLCEKPLGLTADSVNRMLDNADRHGRLLYENLMYLQHPQHATVKTLITEGRIGRVVSLRCLFTFPGPREGDFRLNPSMGGGAFHDLNRYPLSAAHYFLQGKTHRVLRGIVEERDGLTMAMEATSITSEGEQFSFVIAFGRPYACSYEIRGESGSILVERAFTTPPEMENVLHITVNGRDESFSVPPCDHFLATIDHACGLIRGGEWREVHERTRLLAALADTMNNECRRSVDA